jgi:hypothetical protein
MSKEYSENIPLNGSTIAQFQSRAVKAFAALGWKFENFSKIGVSATIPKKYEDDNHSGRVDLSFSGTDCEVSCSLANPPAMATFARKPAKYNVTTFLEKFQEESADSSSGNADEHEKFMTNALMEANRIEQERVAAKEAKAAKIRRIEVIMRCVLPLVLGVCGMNVSGDVSGFIIGGFIGLILNEVLIFIAKVTAILLP